MPDSHKTNNHYYSVDVGPVHLVAYNTEALFWPGSFGVEYIQRMYDVDGRGLGLGGPG